jgi:hypothetical protein
MKRTYLFSVRSNNISEWTEFANKIVHKLDLVGKETVFTEEK